MTTITNRDTNNKQQEELRNTLIIVSLGSNLPLKQQHTNEELSRFPLMREACACLLAKTYSSLPCKKKINKTFL